MVDGFIRSRWVDSHAPWWSLGSSHAFWVLLGLSAGVFSSLARALGVVEFMRCRWVYSCVVEVIAFNRACLVVSGSFRLFGVIGFTCVHPERSFCLSGVFSPWGSLGLSCVVGFTREPPGDRWVHPVPFG